MRAISGGRARPALAGRGRAAAPSARPPWRGRLRPLARLALVVAVTPVVIAGLLAGAAAAGLRAAAAIPWSAADLFVGGVEPDLHRAVRRDLSRPSVVVAADGSVLGRFRPEELYEPIRPDEIPHTVEAAVVASEDRRFWSHPGFDPRAALRALATNVGSGEVEQGGSTITQQVAKNLFSGSERTVQRKIEELRHAVALELSHTKREILAAYLNTAYFGEGAFGVGAAARTYFRKAASELSLSEASLLAGLMPAPSAYSPRRHPDLAERRRQLVLERVAESGYFPPELVEKARHERPEVFPPRPSLERHPYFLDYTRRWLLDVWGLEPRALYEDGLRIETTLDPALQEHARRAVQARLGAPGDPRAAVVVLDPRSGAVRALVGGTDWADSQVNLALGREGGGTGRQPGSAFKPVVLAAAFENGARPGDRVEAPAEYVPAGYDEPVRNYTRRGYGIVALSEAVRRSINTAFVVLAERLGPAEVAELARELGLRGVPEPSSVGPSIGVGSYEVSPLDLASAYAAFANGGHRVTPRPVERILAADRRPVHGDVPPAVGERVLEARTAALVTSALVGVVESGTGTRAQLDRPVAGKTGTSDNAADAWFVGYAPQLVASVWVGHPDAVRPMRDVAGFEEVTGGTVPAAIWRDVMDRALAAVPVVGFPPPPEPPPVAGPQLAPRGGDDRAAATTTTSSPRHGPLRGPGARTPATAAPTTTSTTSPTTTTPTTAPTPTTATTAPPAPETTTPTATSVTTTTTWATTAMPSTRTTTAPSSETSTTTAASTAPSTPSTTAAPTTTTTAARRAAAGDSE